MSMGLAARRSAAAPARAIATAPPASGPGLWLAVQDAGRLLQPGFEFPALFGVGERQVRTTVVVELSLPAGGDGLAGGLDVDRSPIAEDIHRVRMRLDRWLALDPAPLHPGGDPDALGDRDLEGQPELLLTAVSG